MKDLTLDRTLKPGSKGRKVKLVQEWLCLQKLGVAIDGSFGAATDEAVRRFQAKKGLPRNGIVDRRTFAALSQPMTIALKLIRRGRRKLGRAVADYARQHLKQHPREIGGQNRGPWVRLYMDGHEGKS